MRKPCSAKLRESMGASSIFTGRRSTGSSAAAESMRCTTSDPYELSPLVAVTHLHSEWVCITDCSTWSVAA